MMERTRFPKEDLDSWIRLQIGSSILLGEECEILCIDNTKFIGLRNCNKVFKVYSQYCDYRIFEVYFESFEDKWRYFKLKEIVIISEVSKPNLQSKEEAEESLEERKASYKEEEVSEEENIKKFFRKQDSLK